MTAHCQAYNYKQTTKYAGTYSATHFEVTESEVQTIEDSWEYTRRDRIVGRRSSETCS